MSYVVVSLEERLGETPRGRPPTAQERAEARSDARRRPSGSGLWKECVTCGSPFYVKQSKAGQTHCTNRCVADDPAWLERVTDSRLRWLAAKDDRVEAS